VAAGLALRVDAVGAETLGVLAVAPPPGPGGDLVEITLQLRERIAEYSAGTLGAEQLRERMTGPAPGATVPELERAYEGARLAYLNGDYGRSLGTLRIIAGDLEKLPDGAEVYLLWTKAMMRLARTELDLGRPDAARASIERLLRAAPDMAVDRSLYPARFVDEVENARAALKAEPTGALGITSSVPGARVYVNGRDVGTAPVRLVLPRGRYRVSGASGSSRVWPTIASVGEEGREILLDFAIAEALRPSLGPGLALESHDRARQLVAVGGHLGLDRILAISISGESGASHLVASLYDVRRGALEREGRVRLTSGMLTADGSAALAEFLVTGHASQLVEIPGEQRAASLTPVPALSGTRRVVDPGPAEASIAARSPEVLKWTPVATAIADIGFTALAVVELRSAADRYDKARRFRATDGLTTNAAIRTYNGYVADGDAARTRATLYWAGAGVSTLATAILGYVSYKRTGEFGPFRF
jgi:PEGA domain-containing protein